MTENTNEAGRSDGINVTGKDKDDTVNDIFIIDYGRENDAAVTSENITDPVAAVEPAPFEGEDNNQTRMAAEIFAVPTSAVERAPVKVKFGLLPHGAYFFIPALLSTLAWLACLSKDGCDYARVTGPSVAEITNNPDVPFIDVGFKSFREPTLQDGEWIKDVSIPCLEYNDDSINKDGAWYFAYGTAFLGLVLGGGGAMFIWYSSCFVFEKNVWRWAGYELLAATILQSLTYTWFATTLCKSNECRMEYGARADLVATILWSTSTLCIFCRYPRVRVTGQQRREVEMSNQNLSGEQTDLAPPDRDSEIV